MNTETNKLLEKTSRNQIFLISIVVLYFIISFFICFFLIDAFYESSEQHKLLLVIYFNGVLLVSSITTIWIILKSLLRYQFENEKIEAGQLHEKILKTITSESDMYICVISDINTTRKHVNKLINDTNEESLYYYGAVSIIPSNEEHKETLDSIEAINQNKKANPSAYSENLDELKDKKSLYENYNRLLNEGNGVSRFINLSEGSLSASRQRSKEYQINYQTWLQKQIDSLKVASTSYNIYSTPRSAEFGSFISIICSDTQMLLLTGNSQGLYIKGESIIVNFKKSMKNYFEGTKEPTNRPINKNFLDLELALKFMRNED